MSTVSQHRLYCQLIKSLSRISKRIESNMPPAEGLRKASKHPALFQCSVCPKRFTRAFNLRSHLITHTDQRPFACAVCGLDFVRNSDRKSHELIHAEEKKFVCEGDLANGQKWGCGRRFTLGKNLGRHFRSEKGRTCIKPLLDEEKSKRQVAASALTGLAGSPHVSGPTQQHQPPPPTQTWLCNEPDMSMNFAQDPWVPSEEGQLSGPEHAIPRSSMREPPTRDEALKAVDTVRRYIRYHGRLNTEEDGFQGYLELNFKSLAYQATSLDPIFLSGTLAS